MIWSYLHCILGIAMYVALNLEQDPKGISVISLVLPSYCVVLLLGRLCLLPLGKPYLQTKKLSLLHCLSTSLHVSVPKMVVGFFFLFLGLFYIYLLLLTSSNLECGLKWLLLIKVFCTVLRWFRSQGSEC